MTSDDLLALVDGRAELRLGLGEPDGKIDARVFDLIKLRSVF